VGQPVELGGSARQAQPRGFTEHVIDQPAAIEAGLRRAAAPAVGGADQTECMEQQFVMGCCRRYRALRYRGRCNRGCPRRSGTTDQHCQPQDTQRKKKWTHAPTLTKRPEYLARSTG